MTRPPPYRPAEDRLVADACARSRTERIRILECELNRSEYAIRRRARELSAHGGAEPSLDLWNAILDADGAGCGLYLCAPDVGRLAGDDAIRPVALNLALEAERA